MRKADVLKLRGGETVRIRKGGEVCTVRRVYQDKNPTFGYELLKVELDSPSRGVLAVSNIAALRLEPPPPDWKHYIAHQGLACPYCGSTDLEVGAFQADGGYAWQDVTCSGCGRNWEDVYRLVEVDVPSSEEPNNGQEGSAGSAPGRLQPGGPDDQAGTQDDQG